MIGVVLAGGLARRMGGGDKPLRQVAGQAILDHVVARIAPQCDALILNANGDPSRFAGYGLPVVPDTLEDYPGPLAGVLAALDWTAENRPDANHVVSVAGDCPFLPRDLVSRLEAERVAAKAELAAQNRPLDGALRACHRGLAGRSGRSLLQRQYGRRPRRS